MGHAALLMDSQVMKKTMLVKVARLRAKRAPIIMARFVMQARRICTRFPVQPPLFPLELLPRRRKSVGQVDIRNVGLGTCRVERRRASDYRGGITASSEKVLLLAQRRPSMPKGGFKLQHILRPVMQQPLPPEFLD